MAEAGQFDWELSFEVRIGVLHPQGNFAEGAKLPLPSSNSVTLV